MINVLHFGLSPNKGGIENYLYNLTTNAPSNVHFDFINCWNTKVAYEDELKKLGHKFLKITPRFDNYVKCLKELKQIFCNTKYDYIHFHIMTYSFFEPILLAKRYSNSKIIIHCHGGGKKYLSTQSMKVKVLHTIGKNLTKKVNTINLACSSESGIEIFGRKHFIVVKDGIDYKKFKFSAQNREILRKKYKIDSSENLWGNVGTLTAIKNQKFLIKLFYLYQKQHDNVKLMIVGDGSLKNELKSLTKLYKIENKVIFTGNVNNVEKYYSAMDTYLMPSINEGFGISLCEAQINGLYCFASMNFPKEVKLCNQVEFLDLNNIDDWLNKISKLKYIRTKSDLPLSYKYDLKYTLKEVFKIYEENENGKR